MMRISVIVVCLAVLAMSASAFTIQNKTTRFTYRSFIDNPFMSMLTFFNILPRTTLLERVIDDAVVPVKTTGQIGIGRVSDGD